ncbi:MAG: Fur family transcriptional regulator [Candidatus Cloacimonadales bacterium]|jgi:Fur family ferric uptake transcriptional regulator|nr:transcriptional repressor [Candidatus Cloacimonadota bacterium]MDY0380691.1 Fur family transcriptional regulator [Candidatus Cloacimonadaceae bacterium]MCB5255938.1 transcriptional repressor [Candidatus Cloacimonadota bacterium]MCB5264142.1 transcriptional repressor [Candidatus Cloacimonadota bacterium]MCB5276471.1 transcriptional repressor [Candidatus Cloacimonadota bacterium]
MNDYEAVFRQFLEKTGLKLTKSRSLILDAVFKVHEHFDAETLHHMIRGANVSLATVYRTLPLLAEAGLIQAAVRTDGRERFEHILGHPKHVHWICDKCKSVAETDLSSIMPQLHKEAKSINFALDQVTINVTGLCWKCRNSDNESH